MNLAQKTSQASVIPEFVVDINRLDGGDGDDRISSTSEHPGSFDYISGGAGNDTVEFVGNAAEIDLGSGNDILNVERPSSGSNLVIAGGDGDDQIAVEYAETVEVAGGAGSDTLTVAGRSIRIDQSGSQSGDFDVLKLSLDSSLTALERDGGDLVLSDLSGEESVITLVNWFAGEDGKIDEIVFSGGETWSPDDVDNWLAMDHATGSPGNDVLQSMGDRYRLTGLGGNDTLIATGDGALLDGGAGDDDLRMLGAVQSFVSGGLGNDTVSGCGVFAFNRGDGEDTLINFAGTISLGGIAYEDVSVTAGVGEIRLDLGQGDSITLINPLFLSSDGGAEGERQPLLLQIVSETRIDTFDLAAGGLPMGSSLDSAAGGIFSYNYAVNGIAGQIPDNVAYAALNRVDFGSSPQDLALGRSLNEVLIESGAGIQTIGARDGIDTIRFGVGIGPDDLKLGLGSLAIRIGDSGDESYLDNFDPGNAFGPRDFEYFRFHDGSFLTYEQLVERGFDLTGTSAADIIQGTNAQDRIDGKSGDDLLSGGMGGDTYFFGAGSGQDEIKDSSSPSDHDVVRIQGRSEDVTVAREGGDIVISLNEANDRLVLKAWYADPSARIESVVFDGGIAWDADMLEAKAAAPSNRAPLLVKSIADLVVQADVPFSYAIDSEAFFDPDIGDILTLSASLPGGSSFPSWVAFDASTRRFSGMPDGADVGSVELVVTASDSRGASVSHSIGLTVLGTGNAPIAAIDESVALSGGVLEANAGLPTVISIGADSQATAGTFNIGAASEVRSSTTLLNDEPGNAPSVHGGESHEGSNSVRVVDGLVRETAPVEGQLIKDWYSKRDVVDSIQLSLDGPISDSDPESGLSGVESVRSEASVPLTKHVVTAEPAVPGISLWALRSALMELHLSSSDEYASGTDPANFSGFIGGPAGLALESAQAMLGVPGFGSDAQTMQTLAGLSEGLAKLG